MEINITYKEKSAFLTIDKPVTNEEISTLTEQLLKILTIALESERSPTTTTEDL